MHSATYWLSSGNTSLVPRDIHWQRSEHDSLLRCVLNHCIEADINQNLKICTDVYCMSLCTLFKMTSLYNVLVWC